MKNGFNRLKAVGALGALGTVGVFAAGSARAVPTPTKVDLTVQSAVTTATTVSWLDIGNTNEYYYSSITSGFANSQKGNSSLTFSAFGVSEASIYASTTSSSSALGTDAFDGYGIMLVDMEPYVDADGTVDLTGTTVTADPMSMANGLNASIQYTALTDRRVLRMLYTLNNPTGSAINAEVIIGGNLGSNSRTEVLNTSNGNTLVEKGDQWVITDDSGDSGDSDINPEKGFDEDTDPVLTHVVYGGEGIVAQPIVIPGSAVLPSKATQGGFVNDNIYFQYDLSVPAGGTSYILQYVQMSLTLAEANAGVPDFADIDSLVDNGLASGLPDSALANWGAVTAAPAGPATPVPFLSPFGLLVLSGLFGMAAYRRLKTA